MISYRRMNTEDIAAGLRLCRAVNWNQLERDWQIFLELGPNESAVATDGEKVVGTVTTISYQQAFSWIGMVLVDPANRRQGIGVRLLEEALSILQDKATIKLDATPEGRTVYLKLDFKDEYPLSRMKAMADPQKLSISTARAVVETDLTDLVAFDRTIFGADRSSLLQWMQEGMPELAFIEKRQESIQGYCLGRAGYNFTQIGPVVASNIDTAKSLVSAALQNCAGQPVILDALHFDNDWSQWLDEIGFSQQRTFTRMYRGSNLFPGIPERQFAILGPEFG